jgi:hypothetical protein
MPLQHPEEEKDKSMPGLAKQLAKSETERKPLRLEGLDLLKHFALSSPKLQGNFTSAGARDALRTRFRQGGCEAQQVTKALQELEDSPVQIIQKLAWTHRFQGPWNPLHQDLLMCDGLDCWFSYLSVCLSILSILSIYPIYLSVCLSIYLYDYMI